MPAWPIDSNTSASWIVPGNSLFSNRSICFACRRSTARAKGFRCSRHGPTPCPPCCRRHGAFPEMIDDTGGGVLCEPGDPAALAASLKRMILDPDFAGQCGRRAQHAVHQRYNAEVMARMIELYEEIGSRSGRGQVEEQRWESRSDRGYPLPLKSRPVKEQTSPTRTSLLTAASSDPVPMSLLRIEHISKQYPTRGEPLVVLRDVSLELNRGENVAILGPSGSGKSTLLGIIGAWSRPAAGALCSTIKTRPRFPSPPWRRSAIERSVSSFKTITCCRSARRWRTC